ncbi:hypothetical protein SRHO_G00111180 [Serrasalmus rhombeus]
MSSVAMEMRVASPFHLITDERSLCFAQQKRCIVSHPAIIIHLSSRLWPCPCSFLLLPLMSSLPVSSLHHPVFVPGVQTTAVLGSSLRDCNRKRQPE